MSHVTCETNSSIIKEVSCGHGIFLPLTRFPRFCLNETEKFNNQGSGQKGDVAQPGSQTNRGYFSYRCFVV